MTSDPLYRSLLPGGYNALGLKAVLFERSKVLQPALVEGHVYSLLFQDSTNAVDPLCTEWNCFAEENFLWTRLNPSSISKEVDGYTFYLIRGYQDLEGYIWVANFGVICPDTGERTWVYPGVPVLRTGHFQSPGPLPTGIKVVQLVRLNNSTAEPIQMLYGEFAEPAIPLCDFKLNRQYTPEDQQIELETLSFQIISQLLRSDWPSSELSEMHSWPLDPVWITRCQEGIARIASLQDTDLLSPRYGSIPQFITSYLTADQIYNDTAYASAPEVIEENCLEDPCVGQATVLSTSRAVSNRAMAWFLTALCVYHQVVEPSETFIISTANYLIDQIVNGRVREGWTSTAIYLNSQAIDTYSTSTAVVTSLALLKAYEITQDNRYLTHSLAIQQWVFNQQYRAEAAEFAHSLSNREPTVESTVYGTLLSLFFNRLDIAQAQLSRLEEYVNLQLIEFGVLKLVEGEDLLTALTYHLLTQVTSLQTTLRPQLTIWRQSLSSNLNGDLVGTAFQDQNPVFQFLDTHTGLIFDSPYLTNHALPDIEQARFYRHHVLKLLKRAWPVDYTWPTQAAIERGILGQLLRAFAEALAPLFSFPYHFLRATYLNQASPFFVDRWAADLGYFRRTYESVDHYRARLRKSLAQTGSSPEEFNNLSQQFPGQVRVKEYWKDVLHLNSSAYSLKDLVGEAVYEGALYQPFSVEVEVPGLIDSVIRDEIEAKRPAACQLQSVGRLSFASTAKSLESAGQPVFAVGP